MTLSTGVAGLLALAVLLASARMLWRWRSPQAMVRPAPWRASFLLCAQAACAVLLYFVLFPPAMRAPASALTVLTADAANAASDGAPDGRVVALPEAKVPARWLGAERVPDLATALRRYPATRTLHVVGAGLVARDRDAVGGRALRFHPAPLPAGLVELQLPEAVAAGRGFAVRGRMHALAGGSATLLDPAGRRVDRALPDATGEFELHASARNAGLADYALRLRDARGRVVENAVLPLQVLPARKLRMLALAGAPNAELKFLRRWALDAGLALETQIDLGAGLQIASRAPSLDAASLDRLDLLLLDERSWRSLGAGQRVAVLAAVDRGLGLLLRMSAGSGAGDRGALRALGFAADQAPRRDLRLGAGFVRAGDAVDALPPITRSPLQASAGDAVVALADASGTPLAVWRARGRGRIGIATVDDTFRLALAGRADAHGELWSRLASALARAAGTEAVVPTIMPAPPNERTSACVPGSGPGQALRAGAQVVAPDGRRMPLDPDPRTGTAACAGFWASTSGWHRLRMGETDLPFRIPAVSEAPALRARELRDATRALASDGPVGPRVAEAEAPGPRWPWFLGWLLLAGPLWWLERSRHGLRAVAAD